MILYDFRCPAGHDAEHLVGRDDPPPACAACGAPMARRLTFGGGLLYFEEGRARTIENLGDQPVTIRSPAEHRRAMQAAGVTWATRGRGMKGQWV